MGRSVAVQRAPTADWWPAGPAPEGHSEWSNRCHPSSTGRSLTQRPGWPKRTPFAAPAQGAVQTDLFQTQASVLVPQVRAPVARPERRSGRRDRAQAPTGSEPGPTKDLQVVPVLRLRSPDRLANCLLVRWTRCR
ncbi:MAG TPA: hypothetical protein VKE51_08050 [Vicinamibacterales bacterium]|nr:hypothetical protein [Vicinamibacterales bacterium]